MAPRSARKRKVSGADAEGTTPNQRKKREDTPMKLSGAGSGAERREEQPPRVSAIPSATLSTPEQERSEEAVATPQDGVPLLSFDPEESQMMDTMDESPTGEQPEDMFPMMLETQYEEDEDAEEREEHMPYDGALEDNVAFTAADGSPDGVDIGAEMVGDATVDAGYPNGEAEEGEDANRESLIGASASIEEILKQLAEVASSFVTNYRELTSEGDAIQAELNELNEAQEARCAKMLARLERAGNSIFSFGQDANGDDTEAGDDTQALMTQAQA